MKDYMEKRISFSRACFSTEVLEQAVQSFSKLCVQPVIPQIMSVTEGREEWLHADLREFLAEHRRSGGTDFHLYIMGEDARTISIAGSSSGARVTMQAKVKGEIQSVTSIFEAAYPHSQIAEPEVKPHVFIGHGRNLAWRDLKDHLQDKHGHQVIAYETGARAGHTIRDVLEDMAETASIAFLVFTAEDEQKDGEFHARQNVVHETGLFQGKLGFSRGVALIEEGVTPFSNLQGIEQIRFRNIQETFGEVLAVIKREFG